MTARLLLASILTVMPAVALAQETRTAAITAEQAEKATRLAPYETHWAENLLLSVRRGLIEQPSGFYPYFGSVYSGGGFTLGAGYRGFTGDRTPLEHRRAVFGEGLQADRSNRSCRRVTRPATSIFATTASWRDATQVGYHGLGIDSPADIDTGFRMQQALVGGDATVRPHRWVLLTAGASYEDYTLKDPTGSVLTPVDDTFTPETAPGLGVEPTYLHTTAAAAFDSRPAADYARRGGLYRVAHHYYGDRDGTYSFGRLDAEVVQHIPILRENWVLSLRGRLETTLDDDDQVPYFLLPSLGSGSTLRGYSSWRFRDRHAMLLSGEWRWIPNRMAIDMAFFYDTGMVAPRFDAIALGSFVSDFGVGVRFHAPTTTPLRVEVRERVRGRASGICRELGILIMITSTRLVARLGLCCLLAAAPVLLAGAERRFFDDDPLTREPETQDASKVSEWEIDLILDLATNLFGRPGDSAPNVRARNVNTIDEVPDSSWFTNRILTRPLTPDDVSRGPLTGTGPAPGTWTVVSRKLAGFAPGFTMRGRARRSLVRVLRCRGPSRSGHRRDHGRQQALLGARVLAGREPSGQRQPGNRSSSPRRRPSRHRPDASAGWRHAIWTTSSSVRTEARTAAIGPSPPVRCPAVRSAGSATTARVPTTRTTSSRTSTAASCAH